MDRGSRGAAWAGPGARLTAAMGGGGAVTSPSGLVG